MTVLQELLQQLEDYSYTIQTMNKLDISRELPTGETESLTTEADPGEVDITLHTCDNANVVVNLIMKMYVIGH